MLYHYRQCSFLKAVTGIAVLFFTQASSAAPVDDDTITLDPIVDIDPPTVITVNASSASYDATTPVISLDLQTEVANSAGVFVRDQIDTNGSGGIDLPEEEVDTTGTPEGALGPLLPGTYTIKWTATDQGNNSLSVDQTIDVLPIVNFGVDQKVGETVGTVTVTAYLSGPAPADGVRVPFTVTGTATNPADHDAANANIDIPVGTGATTSGTYTFTVVSDLVNDDNETVIFTMGVPVDLASGTGANYTLPKGNKLVHTVTLSESNLAPTATITPTQNAKVTRTLITTDGIVTLTANATDPNGDTITYDWSATDNSLVPTAGTANSTFTFDPAGLSTGAYTTRLTVSDGSKASTTELVLNIFNGIFTLSDTADSDDDGTLDSAEGVGDDDNDGIQNFLDAVANPSWLQGRAVSIYDSSLLNSNSFVAGNIVINWKLIDSTPAASNLVFYPLLITTNPGIQLNLGNIAFLSSSNNARVNTDTVESTTGVNITTNAISTDGKILDLIANNLTNTGQAVDIVIPQTAPLPASSDVSVPLDFYIYSAAKTWQAFTIGGGNAVKTASKDANGFCPSPGHTDYIIAVLSKGDECIQLTIIDGGANDKDGAANGAIQLRGAVFIAGTQTGSGADPDPDPFSGTVETSVESLNKITTTEGGGGSIGWLLIILMLAPTLRHSLKN